jgi:single-strand DNA-binding protein
MTYNDITLIGYVGHDPVPGKTKDGTLRSRFSVATSDRRKAANGEVNEHTSWFRVTAYGRLAEIAQAYLATGKQVFIRGSLRLEVYVDREGENRFSAEVKAKELILTGAAPAIDQRTDREPDEEDYGLVDESEPRGLAQTALS